MNIEFEWDEKKNAANIRARGIDFRDAALAFESCMIRQRSIRNGEERWFGLCELEGVVIVIVYTMRGHKIRIISMRRASRHERKIYKENIENKN
jgi:uncharacterized DUF497 family protein